MPITPEPSAIVVRVRGQVQGVGFRPFVLRLARGLGLAGRVRNEAGGVLIRAEGTADGLTALREALRTSAPPSSRVESVQDEPARAVGFRSFEIEPSGPTARPQVRIPRDLATCDACRREILDQDDRRYAYPFTNCTGCGPRYTILEALPYDRPATSMRRFPLCGPCRAEYESPTDRRFHAEPTACATCGPRLALRDREGRELAAGRDAIRRAAGEIRAGRIVALKGLGGFQLLVRADRSEPVARLRERKGRPSKPLALMVASIEAANQIARVGPEERRLLESPGNPIVLLERRADGPEVAPRRSTLGVMLPTTPLHHLLLADLGIPVVATSGNRGDEPILTDEVSALGYLAEVADAWLVHDRPIVRRADDSVVRVIAGRAVALRLARGLAPLPLPAVERLVSRAEEVPALLATGGHQKVALAFWSGSQAVLGPHLGDLDGEAARLAFERHADELPGLLGARPAAIACDLHPDYFTSRWASERGLPVVRVQHHHAHAVAAMVEHDLLGREVLALTWDGTGYGTDGTLWGGELLRARVDGYERVASLRPFPLPGGEAAIREPRRVALGLLAQTLGESEVLKRPDVLSRLGYTPDGAAPLLATIRRGLNTPWTSSVGRLFDAVAALVLGAWRVSYEGEAAAWLESIADAEPAEPYDLPTTPGDADGPARGDWRPLLEGVLADLDRGEPAGRIAARFHDTLATWAGRLVASEPIREVVLGGGCFQNRRLTESTLRAVERSGGNGHGPGTIPPGDGGLAVGQLAVALSLRSGV